jgi:CubicO group peptidase (beta-lactamase class C family)
MSKPITGVAIMMLMEEGKVRLSDPASKFIPEFKEMMVAVPKEPAPGKPTPGSAETQFYTVPASREITIRDLLTHTSGLVSGPVGTREAAKVARKWLGDSRGHWGPYTGLRHHQFHKQRYWD